MCWELPRAMPPPCCLCRSSPLSPLVGRVPAAPGGKVLLSALLPPVETGPGSLLSGAVRSAAHSDQTRGKFFSLLCEPLVSSPPLSPFMSDVLPRGLILLLSPLPRIMRPDDANVAGNVHGGTILKMIEEAGAIISTRHCNSQNGVSVREPSRSRHAFREAWRPSVCSTVPLLGEDRSSPGVFPSFIPWALGISGSPGWDPLEWCLVWGPVREDSGQPETELRAAFKLLLLKVLVSRILPLLPLPRSLAILSLTPSLPHRPPGGGELGQVLTLLPGKPSKALTA